MATCSYPLRPYSHELEAARQENTYQQLTAETLLQKLPGKKDGFFVIDCQGRE